MRGLAGPLLKRPGKNSSRSEPTACATCLMGGGAQQQLAGVLAAHLVLDACSDAPSSLSWRCRCAPTCSATPPGRRRCGCATAGWPAPPHARHQQRSRLQERTVSGKARCSSCVKPLVAPHGRARKRASKAIAPCAAPKRATRRAAPHRRPCRRRVGEGALQRNARIHVPAGQAVDVAQHVDQAELADLAGHLFFHRDRGACRRWWSRRRVMSSAISAWWRHQRLRATPRCAVS